jgi:hypothetical protein
LLQADIKHIQAWCAANCMKLNISKTRVIIFSRKTNGLYYVYKIPDSSITRTDTIKDLGIKLNSKLHFHSHMDYIFSQSLRTLELIKMLTYSFSTLDCLLLLYSTLVRPKLQYASVVWNSVTSTDARKLERIQRKFKELCQNHFYNASGTYKDFSKNAKLHILYDRRRCIDALFLSLFILV